MKHRSKRAEKIVNSERPTSDLQFALEVEECENKERQFVLALARGLEILRSFEPGDRLLGNQDISRRTGLPKPTVSRLTSSPLALPPRLQAQ